MTTFLAFFQGQVFDVQVSQSFSDGHPTMCWKHGAAMTAKEEGLWDLCGTICREDVRHMQSRVRRFQADAVLKVADFVTIPKCASSFCRWLLTDAAAFAVADPLPPPQLKRLKVPELPEEE